jgi:hypothetical protein
VVQPWSQHLTPQHYLQFYYQLLRHLKSCVITSPSLASSLSVNMLICIVVLAQIPNVLAVELISAANNVNVSITFFSSTTFRYSHNRIVKLYIIYLIPRFLALCIFNITDLILLNSLNFNR